MKVIFFLVFLSFFAAELANRHSDYRTSGDTADTGCRILETLLAVTKKVQIGDTKDSIWIVAIEDDSLNFLVAKLADLSGLNSNRYCGFNGCAYINVSLEKSLFKLDLLRWARYFKCADTSKLKVTSKGYYSERELEMISVSQSTEFAIDTAIDKQ